jgi:hypothetical protein
MPQVGQITMPRAVFHAALICLPLHRRYRGPAGKTVEPFVATANSATVPEG